MENYSEPNFPAGNQDLASNSSSIFIHCVTWGKELVSGTQFSPCKLRGLVLAIFLHRHLCFCSSVLKWSCRQNRLGGMGTPWQDAVRPQSPRKKLGAAYLRAMEGNNHLYQFAEHVQSTRHRGKHSVSFRVFDAHSALLLIFRWESKALRGKRVPFVSLYGLQSGGVRTQIQGSLIPYRCSSTTGVNECKAKWGSGAKGGIWDKTFLLFWGLQACFDIVQVTSDNANQILKSLLKEVLSKLLKNILL